MRVLGLDLGARRIGVAVSDSLGLTAQRLTVLTRGSAPADVAAIRRLVEEHGVGTVVIGLPLTLRGTQGPAAAQAQGFAQRLQRDLGVPVELVDERLTSAQSHRVLHETQTSVRRRGKRVVDLIAAQLILQQFLDARRPSP